MPASTRMELISGKGRGHITYQGHFSDSEMGSSSTERELLAIQCCITAFTNLIQHESVEVRADNFNAASIIKKGGNKPQQAIAIKIFQICQYHDPPHLDPPETKPECRLPFPKPNDSNQDICAQMLPEPVLLHTIGRTQP